MTYCFWRVPDFAELTDKAKQSSLRARTAFIRYVLKYRMEAGETEFEMVQRHIRQAEKHVSQQLEIIAAMTLRNQPIGLAEKLLFNFEKSLRGHRDHLGQITLSE